MRDWTFGGRSRDTRDVGCDRQGAGGRLGQDPAGRDCRRGGRSRYRCGDAVGHARCGRRDARARPGWWR